MKPARLVSIGRKLRLLRAPVAARRAPVAIDAPIESATQDLLRRSPLVARVAEILESSEFPAGRVLAIRGDWGSGKSSFKNLVSERLSTSAEPPPMLDFNPWHWRDADAISRALYAEIAERLGRGWSPAAARRAARLRRYGALLTGAGATTGSAKDGETLATILGSGAVLALAASLGFDLPSATAVAAGLAALAITLSVAGKVITALGRDRGAEPLNEVRREVEESLRELKRPLVIFIDDIDRLEPNEIRELLKQVKANGGLPNIVFVLLFQPSIVEAALDDISEGNGRSFLEKIVQTSFDLPATPASTVHQILTTELSAIVGSLATSENGFEPVRWGNVLVGSIQRRIRNLRDVRRYLSSFASHLPLQKGSTLEVNIIDLIAVEALRVFEPAFYARMFAERDLLLQTNRFRQDGRDAEQRAKADDLLETVAPERRDWGRETIKVLFPTIEGVWGGTSYGDGFYQRWCDAKRICTSRYFSRYFELQTSEGEISESEFAALISVAGDARGLDDAVAAIRERELLPSLAARLDESVHRLPAAAAGTLLPVMFSIAQELVAGRRSGGFDSPWTSAWRATSWYLKSVPTADRGREALDALRKTGALSLAAILIHLNDPADCPENERENFEPNLTADELAQLKTEWLRQLEALAAYPPRLLAQPDLASLLYRWRDYTGSLDAPRGWLAKVITDDAAFATVVESLMSRGTSRGWGDRVAARHDTFQRDTIEDMIGVDEAARRLTEIDLTAFEGGRLEALETLIQHLRRWSEGGQDD